MAEARRKAEWRRTCELLAMIYAMHKSKDAPARSAQWFFDRVFGRARSDAMPVTDDMTILKTVFVDQKIPTPPGLTR
jgi:hypothetical protein